MKIDDIDFEIVSHDGLDRHVRASIDDAKLADMTARELTSIQQTYVHKGFRPGKYPLGLLKKRLGDKVRDDQFMKAAKAALQKYVDQREENVMRYYAERTTLPSLKDDQYHIDFFYVCAPEFPQVDFSAIQIEKIHVDPTDAEVEELTNIMTAEETADDCADDYAAGYLDRVEFSVMVWCDGQRCPSHDLDHYFVHITHQDCGEHFWGHFDGARRGDIVELDCVLPGLEPQDLLYQVPVHVACRVSAVVKRLPIYLTDDGLPLTSSDGESVMLRTRERCREQFDLVYGAKSKNLFQERLEASILEHLHFEIPDSYVHTELQSIAPQDDDNEADLTADDEAALPGDDKAELPGDDEPSNAGESMSGGEPDGNPSEAPAPASEDLPEGTEAEALRTDMARRRHQRAIDNVRLRLFVYELGRRYQVELGEQEIERYIIARLGRLPSDDRQADYLRLVAKNELLFSQISDRIEAELDIVDRRCSALEFRQISWDHSVAKDARGKRSWGA